jgi:hypothetical protein
VKDLVARLAALDADAGAAVRVITYFDQLSDARAGLQAIVRGAAVLAGCPAGLADEERRVQVRVWPDGTPSGPADFSDPSWPSTPVRPGDSAVLWLERSGPAGPVEAMVLERAAAAARAVIDRTRGGVPARSDSAAVEVLIDENAPPEARRHAARTLGMTEGSLYRAVALEGGGARIEPGADGSGDQALGTPAQTWDSGASPSGPRAGVGPAVRILNLPASCAAARTALRFAAAGTVDDPGPRTVHADQLGGMALLAKSVGTATPLVPDELALKQAATAAPWVLSTLDAVARTSSLRAAAAALGVHHSTLQDRVIRAERLLGWPVREPQGQLRLQLALILRRLRHHPTA